MGKCAYVLKTWSKDEKNNVVPPVYCGKRTGWKIIRDDNHNKVRKYNNFCDEHQKIVDATPNDDSY